jgi:hypothetical protein
MSNARLEALTWVLIYGGLLALSLALFVLRDSAPFGWTLVVGGGAATVAGVVLIWLRSRREP